MISASDGWLVVLSIGLVLLAGLLVSAETAFGRVSRSRVEDLSRDRGEIHVATSTARGRWRFGRKDATRDAPDTPSKAQAGFGFSQL